MLRTPETQLQLWNDVKKVIDKYYYKFDHTSLMVALCQYVSHYLPDDPPVWSLLLGPSSAGKSSVIIKGVSFFPDTYTIDMLTTNSFLSGFGRNNGILKNLPLMFPLTKENPTRSDPSTHGIVLISDFSTILGLAAPDRINIQAQLRKMFDGSLDKTVGNRSTKLEWKGKVTIIAAGVPSVEEYSSIERDLGERFLHYKMPEYDKILDQSKIATTAIDNLGKEKQFNREFEIALKNFVGINQNLLFHVSCEGMEIYKIEQLVAVLTKLRQRVVRDYTTPKRDILGLGTLENTGRLVKSLLQLAKAHCMLMRRKRLDSNDIKILKRVAWGCIPNNRKRVLQCFLKTSEPLQRNQLEHMSKLARMTLHYLLGDLVALGILIHEDQSYELDIEIRNIIESTWV